MLDGSVDLVPDLFDLGLPVEISSDDVIGLNEGIEFSLEVLVLLGQEGRMLLEGFVFGFQVQVSVHQGLVGVVHGFKIGVLGSLVDLEAVEFGFQALQLGSEFVCQVVFLTVLGQFLFLFFNKKCVSSFKGVDLEIESVDHALELGDVSLGCVDLDSGLLSLFGALVQLVVEGSSSIH